MVLAGCDCQMSRHARVNTGLRALLVKHIGPNTVLFVCQVDDPAQMSPQMSDETESFEPTAPSAHESIDVRNVCN